MKQDLIWDYLQNNQTELFSGAMTRLTWIQKKLKKGQRVLNIGVGDGMFERLSLNNNIDIYALDPSENSINKLKQSLNLENKAKTGYSQEIPFNDDFFDVVVMSEVLEHLSDDILQKTLLEVRRVLKKDGIFLGTVPARENLSDSIAVCPECACHFHRWGHVQTFNTEKLKKLLSPLFRINIIEERLFVNWTKENWKAKIVYSIKLCLLILGIHGSNENIYFEVAKP